MIYNEEFETLPREALDALQLKRLQQVAQRVYHTVGFYRTAFDEAGVKPDDIKSLADLARLPLHQAGSAGQLPFRSLCRSDEQRSPASCLIRNNRRSTLWDIPNGTSMPGRS